LRARLIHPQARDLPLRANRYSTGDGMRLGRSVGAAVGEPGAGFYGHLIPAGIPYDDPAEFADLTFYHSEHGTLVNRAGRRFVDESRGDQISPMHLVRQPEARALLIYDQQARERWELQPYVEGIAPLDKFTLARERGARCAVVRHVNELARPATQWGYPGAETVAAVRGRRGEPPYYVIEVAPAITFSFTGLRIDPQARVLDERGAPIPCLLAAGADTGGVFVRAYAGGLANALIFGLQAAETALAA
jgi:succinate dehydrogenase/fumarate reductase flavoprotein subunit